MILRKWRFIIRDFTVGQNVNSYFIIIYLDLFLDEYILKTKYFPKRVISAGGDNVFKVCFPEMAKACKFKCFHLYSLTSVNNGVHT